MLTKASLTRTDAQIKEELAENWYQNEEQIVRAFVDADPHTPEELIQTLEASDDQVLRTFSKALRESWNVYAPYWRAHAKTFTGELQENIATLPWVEWAQKMSLVTGEVFDVDMLSISAEPLMESAMYLEPNVCIGPIRKGNDSGFVHEGLHLLLKERWADDPRITSLMPDEWSDPFWHDNWRGMFEQAIVVSLDSLIRGNDQSVESYFKGCRVGELYPYFYEPIKQWYEAKLRGEEQRTLSDVVAEVLSEHKSELIDQHVEARNGG